MMKKTTPDIDLKTLKKSRLYSEELGIDLAKQTDAELFKWFLASILFGARISETIARHTYETFARYHLLTPKKILKAGWDFLVCPVMREGGYVRYDEKTSRQLLKNCEMLLDIYDGRLNKLHNLSKDNEELESRLIQFYGIGPVTANIFLRELRPYWKKSNPEPLTIIKTIAKDHGINLKDYNRNTITFTRLEAGLLRARDR